MVLKGGPVRVGIVGAGPIAREHLRAIAACEDTVAVGVAGRDPARLAAISEEFGVLGVSGVEALWRSAAPELVVLCVGTLELVDVIAEAAAFGWTILMEKPPGRNLSEAEKIGALLGDRPAYVALNRRFLGATLATRRALDADAAKGLRFITVQDQQDIAAFAALPRKTELEARNLMYANSIHLIDYFRSLGRAELAAVEPFGRFDPETTFCQVARLRYANGDEGLYQGFWRGAGGWSVSVTTAAARYRMAPLETSERLAAGSRTPEMLPADPADARCKPGFLRQIEAAAAAARGLPSPAPRFSEALETMRLIGAIYGGYEA